MGKRLRPEKTEKGVIVLNADDLLAMARRKSVEGRSQLAQAVSDLFLDRGTLSDAERSMMFDILHRLIKEVEKDLRAQLAERLAEVPDAPRALIADLANDDIEIAYPILSKSAVLQDEDLIEIIRQRTKEHQLAIAIRSELGPALSEALVATGEEDVIRALLENENASLSIETMQYLVEESRRITSYQEPLVRRKDLPAELAVKMMTWVGKALRSHILEKYGFPENALTPLFASVQKETSQRFGAEAKDPMRAYALADTLERSGNLTPDILVPALREGTVSLFFALFCKLTQLDGVQAQRIVYDPGGQSLAIACRAIGCRYDDVEALMDLAQRAEKNKKPNTGELRRQALRDFKNMSTDAAQQVLSQWRTGDLGRSRLKLVEAR